MLKIYCELISAATLLQESVIVTARSAIIFKYLQMRHYFLTSKMITSRRNISLSLFLYGFYALFLRPDVDPAVMDWWDWEAFIQRSIFRIQSIADATLPPTQDRGLVSDIMDLLHFPSIISLSRNDEIWFTSLRNGARGSGRACRRER